jgi:hypothetical protein
MVGHQDIGVNVDPVFEGSFGKNGEIALPVNRFDKTGRTVVAPLDNVMGATRRVQPRQSGHCGTRIC